MAFHKFIVSISVDEVKFTNTPVCYDSLDVKWVTHNEMMRFTFIF